MVMIRARMQDATEQVLSRTQYGFRLKRSASHEEIKKNPSIRFSIAGCLFVPGIVHSP